MTWANKIATGILNANLSAYIYWQGFEVNQFQASSYLVASDGTNVTPSGRLWAFAMWSRFIRPGARRVAVSGSISNVPYGAFKNADNSLVVVLTNNNGGAQSAVLAFSGYDASSASAWVTDNSRAVASLGVTLSGGRVTVSIPARSVVTVRMNGTGNTNPPPSTTAGPTTAPNPTTTSAPNPTGCTVALYGQCGGQGYTGCTTCAAGSTCKFSNDWYSQCL